MVSSSCGRPGEGKAAHVPAWVQEEAVGQRAPRSAAQASQVLWQSQRSLLNGIPGLSGKASSSLFSLEDEEFFLSFLLSVLVLCVCLFLCNSLCTWLFLFDSLSLNLCVFCSLKTPFPYSFIFLSNLKFFSPFLPCLSSHPDFSLSLGWLSCIFVS